MITAVSPEHTLVLASLLSEPLSTHQICVLLNEELELEFSFDTVQESPSPERDDSDEDEGEDEVPDMLSLIESWVSREDTESDLPPDTIEFYLIYRVHEDGTREFKERAYSKSEAEVYIGGGMAFGNNDYEMVRCEYQIPKTNPAVHSKFSKQASGVLQKAKNAVDAYGLELCPWHLGMIAGELNKVANEALDRFTGDKDDNELTFSYGECGDITDEEFTAMLRD